MNASESSIIENGIIFVCSGRISFVGTMPQFESFSKSNPLPCNASILELDPRDVILPAFINAHTHAAMSLFKNLGNDRALSDWLQNFIFPLEAALVDQQFCRIGATLTMAELLASGVSTFADMYFFQNSVAEEVEKVGMRAFLGQGIIDFPQPDSPNPNTTLIIAEEFIKRWRDHPLVSQVVAPHAPYTTSKSVYQAAVALNRKYSQRTWTHCSETMSENADTRAHQGLPSDSNITAPEFLENIGVLGPDVTCAHSVWLTDSDIQIYKRTGTSAAHCPSSNLKLASGFMRYSAMRNADVPIAFGTDGHASNNDVDMVEEARIAAFIHKGIDLDPLTLPALDAVRHLTSEAAEAVGRSDVQGSIETGKFADFAIFGGNSVKWTPRYDIKANGSKAPANTAAVIVYDSNAADVKGTVVNGRVLYNEGCFTTLHITRVLSDATQISSKVRDFLADSRR